MSLLVAAFMGVKPKAPVNLKKKGGIHELLRMFPKGLIK